MNETQLSHVLASNYTYVEFIVALQDGTWIKQQYRIPGELQGAEGVEFVDWYLDKKTGWEGQPVSFVGVLSFF